MSASRPYCANFVVLVIDEYSVQTNMCFVGVIAIELLTTRMAKSDLALRLNSLIEV